jgi:adhesin/invasin
MGRAFRGLLASLPRRCTSFGAAIVVLAGVAGCQIDGLIGGPSRDDDDDGGGGPSPPAELRFAVQPAATLVNEPIVPSPEIVIADSAGNRDTDFNGPVTIALQSTTSGAQLSGSTTREANNGIVTFPDLEIDRPGTGYRLRATASGVPAVTSAAFVVSAPDTSGDGDDEPSVLAAVSGSGQTGTVGQELGAAYVVRVTDAAGSPVAGVVVGWTVTAGGGSVSATSSSTNSSGQASTTHTLGTGTGAHSVRASVSGLTAVNFSATAQAGAADVLVFTAQPTSADVGEAITPAVEITARDQYGNRATSFSGTVSLELSGGSSSASLGGTAARAASNGIATFSGLTVSAAGSSYRLTASANGVPSATSAAFNIIAPDDGGGDEPTAISIVSGNGQSGTVGEAVGDPYVVRVTDGNGNPVAGVPVSWSVTSGGGSVSPTSSTTNSNGQASATHTLGTGTGAQSVRASVSGLTPVTFTATAQAGAPASLVFTTQPSDAGMGQTISPAVRVTVRDQFGNTVTGYSGSITVSIVPLTGTPLANLSGTRTRQVINGVATFDDLSINLLGVGYRLRATGDGLTVDSEAFTILL